MFLKYDLYCPSIKRNVMIQISVPKNYENLGITFDSLYMFDGQNTFQDRYSAFGRSLHMGRYLAIMANVFNKRIIGISIDNAGSDLGRINEYTPFKLERCADENWQNQDVNISKAFTKDFIETIIPFIQNKFPVSKEPSHTFLFGSSLSALYASYLLNLYPNIFGGAGLFSNCPFLIDKAYYRFLNKHLNKDSRTFIYVGMEEESDGDFDKTLYYNNSLKLYNYLKNHQIKVKMVANYHGIHNEDTWERFVLQFLSFMYFDDLELTYY